MKFKSEKLVNASQLSKLEGKMIRVYEKIDASHFYVTVKNGDVEFFKKPFVKKIDRVHRTVISYYEKPFTYITERIKQNEIKNARFGFLYLPDFQPVSRINYRNVPSNNVFLVQHNLQLNNVHSLLGVDLLPLLYEGDATDIFTGCSFDEVLNSLSISTKSKFNPNVEMDGITIISDNLMLHSNNPFYEISTRERHLSDQASLAISDFTSFVVSRNFQKPFIAAKEEDLRWLESFCFFFNLYVEENFDKLVGIEYNSSVFSLSPMFRVNYSYITNKTTVSILRSEQSLHDLFKILASTLRKKSRKQSSFEDYETVSLAASVIDQTSESKKRGFVSFLDWKLS